MRSGAALAAGLVVGSAAQARPDFSYLGSPVAIADGTGVGAPGAEASAAIVVTGPLTVTSISCSLHIPHTFQGDLRVVLRHVESGRSAVLIDRPYVPQTALGFPARDYGAVGASLRLADSGASKYDVPAVAAPGITGVNGVWKPEAPLSVFHGVQALGTWKLVATDYASGDTGSIVGFSLTLTGIGACYANCDGATVVPYLNAADFQCFMNKYVSADAYANCDQSTAAPVLNIVDFQCFMSRYAAGCTAP